MTMIVDGHVHIWENEASRICKGDGSLEALLRQLDGHRELDKVVLLPIAPHVSNAFIGAVCSKHPEKFIGFASADPNAKNAVKTFAEDVRRYHLKGLKLHPRLQKLVVTDAKVVRMVRKAAELKVPVLIDCFPQRTAAFPLEHLLPETIGELAKRVPEANIILAHAGGYKLWDALAVAKACPNIYFDFSFSPHYFKGSSIAEDLAFVLKKMGAKRCIYGSDYPEVSFDESLTLAKNLAKNAELSPEDTEYFFGKTLLSLLPAD